MVLDPRFLTVRCFESPLEPVVETLHTATMEAWTTRRHGLLNMWKGLLHALPEIETGHVDLTSDAVTLAAQHRVAAPELDSLRKILKSFHPWRKGPFNIFGVEIDSEWRSNLKWSRLQRKIAALEDRLVIDVGCGNGYYMFRMLGEGARFVLGIDPSVLFLAQFQAILKYAPELSAAFLPLRSEEFPATEIQAKGIEFDSAFSMGLLYHRRNPQQHLMELAEMLRLGGEVVVETLVVDDRYGDRLTPKSTYAKMPNVWSIPSAATLKNWLRQCGFGEIRTLDVSSTFPVEQRKTEWMTFESLEDFLDANDRSKTIEGYPAPVRAIVAAQKTSAGL